MLARIWDAFRAKAWDFLGHFKLLAPPQSRKASKVPRDGGEKLRCAVYPLKNIGFQLT